MAHKKSFLFLISHNDLPTIFCEPFEEKGQIVRGQCNLYVQETFEWPARIQRLILTAEDRHQAQRLSIENEAVALRKTFDKDLVELATQIKKQSIFSDLKTYQRAYSQLKESKTRLDAAIKTSQ